MTQEQPANNQPQGTDEKETRTKSRDPLVGTVLDGRFQIEEVLGTGGMSVVYKATQLRVNRHVAIKTLRLQLDEKEIYRERFQREISSLCALSHPNIVTVYDCLIGPDDQPYIVMDYLRGRSLEALIEDEGPMNVERFARISIQICSALDHAHKKGIIHRDLKPGNVVLMDNEMDFVKVVDFGLAKIGDQNKRLTHSGELWGSPPYMSPEQCMGESLDQRSDLYSVGAVMYEMLTGKDPYCNATTVFEFIKFHTSVMPPPMMTANPQVSIPPKVEAVVFRALEKDPAKRYQSAKELQDAIVEASSGSVDREKGEFLFHLANQASTKPPSGQTLPKSEQVEAVMTASQVFKRALNPLADEMLQPSADLYTPEAFNEGQAQSFTPSVERWRTPGAPSLTQGEVVRPAGEIVQPAGEIVPPPGIPLGVSAPAAPVVSKSSPSPPSVPKLGVPPAPTASLAGARQGPVPNSTGGAKISRSDFSADAPESNRPWLLVLLLVVLATALTVVLVITFFPSSRTFHRGQQLKTASPIKTDAPAATSPDQTQMGGAGTPPAADTASGEQPSTGPSDKDKTSTKVLPKASDEVGAARLRARHLRGRDKPQWPARSSHPGASTAQGGGNGSHNVGSATNGGPAPARGGGKADPWSTLEKMR